MIAQPPLGMLAELTHRCPLHCPYCSNPIELVTRENEMSTDEWLSVIDQARELGVLQVHMSGGEPLARQDLPVLVERASDLGCYVNLVTSGLGLTEERLADLVERGLAHVQLSVQGADAEMANRIAGVKAHNHKLAAARAVKKLEMPLTVNVVLHRANHHQVGDLIALAEEMGADRLELANTQYYGWGLRNRAALMPTTEQLTEAEPIVRAATERLRGTMQIVYVVADYYERYPKPCMYGWGSRQLTVAPNGDVLPCPAASSITTLKLDNVRSQSLEEIWYRSDAFNAYRGDHWMPDPCKSCSRKAIDFGGCRCQAFLLTGDAAATDPVCSMSPDRGIIDTILAGTPSEPPEFVMRKNTIKVV
ncbi:pyrroloquinoline quinone biosynthesis protein PqqE [Kibdelosporangium philippinense]|uniref:PqqA peptide cyclase n=1 Tax=Kibdelosporangium philippinense TaxID=211113 RepID=A0ABS8ZJR2_9PSEU|nr:pyrroloquinoline quinone biosynthesis protein PqqE [Kibdelosporangium philippinense]MCE7008055.1 pyrroloquinoline quinone biosynthesis protein PqqE [Kibdelosporangium philippinense]